MKEYSIIICTYNGSKNIGKVLDSILKIDSLNLLLDKILIVNNASTDNVGEIIDEYIKKDPKLIFTEYEPKQGLTYARMHFKSLNTKWIIFLDDDNIVDSQWLVNMDKFLKFNLNVGVANSACVAVPGDGFSSLDLDILYAVCPAIACTHSSIEDYKNKKKTLIKFPFGAGLFVLREPLIDYLNNGWTTNIGRQGDNLLSGEDGEIANYVIAKGYKYLLNCDAYILHLIPHKRIEKDYVEKLSYGLSVGYVNALKKKKKYRILKRVIIIRNLFLIIIFPIKQMFTNNSRKRIVNKIEIESRKTINKLLKSK